MNASRNINPQIDKWISVWMAIGFFEMLTGLYLLPSINNYITSFYLLFLLPSLIVLIINIKTLTKLYFRGGALIFLLFLFYLALSSLWGDATELVDHIKRMLTIATASFGVFYLANLHPRYFYFTVIMAVFTVATIGLFWLIDFYFLMENPLSLRFLYGRSDYFNLYDKNPYATFYNPLLFSHTLSFYLTLTLCLFCQKIIANRYLKLGLICAGCILFIFLIAAQTKMAWITVLAVYFSAIILVLGRKGLIISLLVAAALLLIFFQLDHPIVEKGLSHRPIIWIKTLTQMPGNWVFGHGMGSPLEIVIPNYHWYDPHNIYLAILFYSGILGLTILFAALIKTIFDARLQSQLPTWFILFLVYVLFSGMADGGGLLSRPNAHWFNLVIPLMFLLAYSRNHVIKNGPST